VTDARKIRLLRATIKRAILYVPSPVATLLWQILDLTM
jgi:hypothetical protein